MARKPGFIYRPRSLFPVFFIVSIILSFTVSVFAWTDGQVADLVLGPTTFSDNTAGLGQARMNGPRSTAVDPTTGKVFVCDTNNNRVLRFASWDSLSNGQAAEGILGQTLYTTNAASTTQSGFDTPYGIHVDSGGRLWVADRQNHRVLRFDNASTKANGSNANGVLGQADFVSGTANRGGVNPARNTFSDPFAVFVDSDGRLWVADKENHRVLRFDGAASKAHGADADAVLGQADYITGAANRGGAIAAGSLNRPYGLFVDSDGRLWVADNENKRVLRFDDAASKPDGASSNGILGQTLYTTNATAINQSGFMDCGGVTGDSSGTIFVHDTANHRILIFMNAASKANGADADNVLGQGDFFSGTANRGGTTGSSTLDTNVSSRLFFDSAAKVLWMPDNNNNRVLAFKEPTATTTTPTYIYVTEDGGGGGGCFISEATRSR